jgi:hypothetical protein
MRRNNQIRKSKQKARTNTKTMTEEILSSASPTTVLSPSNNCF